MTVSINNCCFSDGVEKCDEGGGVCESELP